MMLVTAGPVHNRGRDPHIYAQPTHYEPKLRDRGGPCCKCVYSNVGNSCLVRLAEGKINKDVEECPWAS